MFTKKLFLPLMLIFLMTQTGCITYIEELFLKKDGTGQFKITFDMSAMMDEEMMKSMAESLVKDMMPEGEEAAEPKEEVAEVEEDKPPVELDSIIKFNDPKLKLKKKFKDNPDFLDKGYMRIVTSDSKKQFLMSWVLDFENFDDVDYFYNNFDKLMKEDDKKDKKGGGGPMNFGKQPDVKNLYSISGDKLTRKKAPMDTEKLSEEDKGMIQMMFGDAVYRSIIHLPGKVKKASNPDAKIAEDGKTVIIEVPFLDYIEGKKNLENVVKFE